MIEENQKGEAVFVSSYNTYIVPSPTDTKKTPKESKTLFTPNTQQTSASELAGKENLVKLPVNFISDYKVLNNQQKLHQQTQQFAQKKFIKINTLQTAQIAYKANESLFSLIQKPKVALAKPDTKLPDSPSLKIKVINTYIENDNYYKITA